MWAKITTKDLVVVFLVVTISFDVAHTASGKFIITNINITKRVENIENLNLLKEFKN